MIIERSPDVVLLDVHMPDGGGRAVLEGVITKQPTVKFLALSVSDAAEDAIASQSGEAEVTPPPFDPELDQLTVREREVLRLIARGYAYKEIATELSIS